MSFRIAIIFSMSLLLLGCDPISVYSENRIDEYPTFSFKRSFEANRLMLEGTLIAAPGGNFNFKFQITNKSAQAVQILPSLVQVMSLNTNLKLDALEFFPYGPVAGTNDKIKQTMQSFNDPAKPLNIEPNSEILFIIRFKYTEVSGVWHLFHEPRVRNIRISIASLKVGTKLLDPVIIDLHNY